MWKETRYTRDVTDVITRDIMTKAYSKLLRACKERVITFAPSLFSSVSSAPFAFKPEIWNAAVTTQFRQIRRTCSRAPRHERHVEKSASREFIHGDRLSRGVHLFKRHDRSTSVDRAAALALIHFAYTRLENGFSIFRVSRTPPTWPLSRSRTSVPGTIITATRTRGHAGTSATTGRKAHLR